MKNKKKIIIATIGVIIIILAIVTGFAIQEKTLKQTQNQSVKLQNSYNELNKKYDDACYSNRQAINTDNQIISNLTNENKALKDKISELKKSQKASKSTNSSQKEVSKSNKSENAKLPHAYFTPNNLLAFSNTNYASMKTALKGTALESVSDVFVDAEKEYGINAIFLAGLVAQESGWGTSFRSQYENNMTGYMVYSPASQGTGFTSKRDNIMATAKLLRYKYLRDGGSYYEGLDIWSVNRNYCATGGYYWANSITSISRTLVKKINN